MLRFLIYGCVSNDLFKIPNSKCLINSERKQLSASKLNPKKNLKNL